MFINVWTPLVYALMHAVTCDRAQDRLYSRLYTSLPSDTAAEFMDGLMRTHPRAGLMKRDIFSLMSLRQNICMVTQVRGGVPIATSETALDSMLGAA
jgi:hypothetical protein